MMKKTFFSLAVIAFFPMALYAQDTTKTDIQFMQKKIQLLEYEQQLLRVKMELLENQLKQNDGPISKAPEQINFPSAAKAKVPADSTGGKSFKSAFTMSIMHFAEGTMQLGYERALKDYLSLEIDLSGSYATVNGFGSAYVQNQTLSYFDELTSDYIYYDANLLRGLGAVVKLKYYLLNKVKPALKAPLGLYAAPQILYRRIWLTGNRHFYPQGNREITRNLDVLSGGIIFGGKFTIAKVLCMDIFAGGMMRLSKYYNESGLTRYKKWYNIDYSGVIPSLGVNLGFLR